MLMLEKEKNCSFRCSHTSSRLVLVVPRCSSFFLLFFMLLEIGTRTLMLLYSVAGNKSSAKISDADDAITDFIATVIACRRTQFEVS